MKTFTLSLVSVIAMAAQAVTEGRPQQVKNSPRQAAPAVISMSARDWTDMFSQAAAGNKGVQPVADRTGTGWYLDFPLYTGSGPCYLTAKGCPRVGYVVTDASGITPPVVGQVMTMQYRIVANNAVLDYQTEAGNTCSGQPSDFSLFMQRQGDDYSGQGPYEFFRQFAFAERITLINGTYDTGVQTLSVPLNPALWISVFGKSGDSSTAATDGFSGTLANLQYVGFVNGGGCFAGHGDFLDLGTLRLYVIGFTIQ